MINKCIFIGNLGRDPEMKYSQGGAAICNFSIACTETWTTNGKKEERTEWIKIVVFKRLAEICGEYLTKGSMVYIEGRYQTRKWQDKDGNDRYTTEIIAREMKMLGARGEKSSGQQQGGDEPPWPEPSMGDDVPF